MTSQTIIRDIQDKTAKAFTPSYTHTQLELEPGPEPDVAFSWPPGPGQSPSCPLEHFSLEMQTFSLT